MKAWEERNWIVVRSFAPVCALGIYCPGTVVEEFFREFIDAFRVYEGWKVLHPTCDVRIYELHRGTK